MIDLFIVMLYHNTGYDFRLSSVSVWVMCLGGSLVDNCSEFNKFITCLCAGGKAVPVERPHVLQGSTAVHNPLMGPSRGRALVDPYGDSNCVSMNITCALVISGAGAAAAVLRQPREITAALDGCSFFLVVIQNQ